MSGAAHAYENALYDTRLGPYRHREPEQDGIPDFDWDDYCGFEKPSQIRDWFVEPAIYHVLDDRDIWVCLYEVDDQFIKYGRTQLVFERRQATLVDKQLPSVFALSL